jgi:hypothetical protein
MSWRVTWRDTQNAYVVQKKDAQTEAEALDVIKDALTSRARDLSVTLEPPESELGGVPFPEIISALKEKTVVPFLGAGVPFSGRPRDSDWNRQANFLPNGAELARYLAFKCNLPAWRLRDTENLARVASYYTITNPKAPLANELKTIFSRGVPTEVHRLLAEPELQPMLIVTTNYDTLMEQALDAAKVEYDTVIHCTDLEHLGSVLVQREGKSNYVEPTKLELLPKRTVLYKMHGSVARLEPQAAPAAAGSFVITEEDYVHFLSRISTAPPVLPTAIRRQFELSSFLFLGYSLEDWNVRVILDSLNEVMKNEAGAGAGDVSKDERSEAQASGVAAYLKMQLPERQHEGGPRRHWAIQYKPTSYDIEIWRYRNVTIRNMELNTFVTELRNPERELFP